MRIVKSELQLNNEIFKDYQRLNRIIAERSLEVFDRLAPEDKCQHTAQEIFESLWWEYTESN
jgi:hypothetical protein